ncbi:MAG: hypothetical protein C4K47_06375, partial [Candidatus Thorarchaeota archaeon]
MKSYYPGGEIVIHTWYHIAKAEYFVLTASMRKHRPIYVGAVFALAILWAIVVAPIVVGLIIGGIIPMSTVRDLLMFIFPGLMRGAMMYLWAMLLLYPLSNALQEVKIGQWEIMLSHKV